VLVEQINISAKTLSTGLILLVLGFALMAIGSDTYGFMKLTIAPVLLVSGYVVIVLSVLKNKG
jgi:hypothetical protein